MGEILGVNVEASSYENVAARTLEWARRGESRAVCFSTVHMIIEARDDAKYRALLNQMDIVNPDGVPLVWSLRALGEPHASRVYGPDTTELLLDRAEAGHLPVAFYGGSQSTLDTLITKVRERYPHLQIAYTLSPPYRPLTPEEDEQITQDIVASGARLVFVGLGCPKQERWVMEHRGRIPAVLLAVGAAFDFLAGSKPQAPRWMMRNGLEWLFRMATEPRRLAGRYLKTNPRFMVNVLWQIAMRRGQKSA